MTVTSLIHLFLSIRYARWIVIEWQPSACPDCQRHRRHRSISLAGQQLGLSGVGSEHLHEHDFKDVQQPLFHSGDVDSRESSEYQTSGFNSPRRSAETLATDMRTDLGDIADRLA
jgi:hypothetical protein